MAEDAESTGGGRGRVRRREARSENNGKKRKAKPLTSPALQRKSGGAWSPFALLLSQSIEIKSRINLCV